MTHLIVYPKSRIPRISCLPGESLKNSKSKIYLYFKFMITNIFHFESLETSYFDGEKEMLNIWICLRIICFVKH